MTTYRDALDNELAHVTALGNTGRADAIRAEIARVDEEAPDGDTTSNDQADTTSDDSDASAVHSDQEAAEQPETSDPAVNDRPKRTRRKPVPKA